jgi:hypothetical protein
MQSEKKESYWIRIKKVKADLLELGISSGLAKKLIYSYRLSVLERLIKATEKRQPREPVTYFLNGLRRSAMKHELQRGPMGDEDIN